MRICKEYAFGEIKGFKLGWSPFGSPFMTVYCYCLGDLMVDTGQAHMQNEVLKIAGDHDVQRIFLTHHHEDHSGNAAAIKSANQARVFGHSLTQSKMAATFRILPYQKYVWGKSKPLRMEAFPARIETALGDMVPVPTPGHSRDHTAYLLKDAGVLFSGDLYLADTIKYFRADEDLGAQIETLRRVLDLDFDSLLCSHFPRLENGKRRIEKKLAFLETLYGEVIRLREKGYPAKRIFKTLNLKEDYFIKYFCFGNVSLLNGVRSIIRHHETERAASR